MKRLYDYIMGPKLMVQLHSHQKDWGLWWGLLAITGGLSMIKWSSMGMIAFLSVTIIHLVGLIIMAAIIDSTAQLLDQPGQLKNTMYWLGFSQAILWLMPSLAIIQNSTVFLGSMLVFGLNIIYFYYIGVTLRQIYNVSYWRLLAIVTVPFLGIIGLFVAGVFWVIQLAWFA
ncbi:MAG: YIP1 family protein [Candidatus Marinamargulisbacteria bacterium]